MFFVRLRSFPFLPNPSFLRNFHSHSQPHSFHNPGDAVSHFNRMLQMRSTPPIFEFGKVLTSLVKMKHYSTAISLSRQMESSGIAPNIVTLNILINCYCYLGQTTSAFSVLANILKRGFQPTTITFTTLIKGLCLHGNVHRALQFHDVVLAQGFQLDQVSYGTLINGLCKIGETRAALELLMWIEGRGIKPNVVMYNTIIDSLCKDKLVVFAVAAKSVTKTLIGRTRFVLSVLVDLTGTNDDDKPWVKCFS
ncbi:putative pentatricopeptide repeat-containing protein At1g12700, mitochondrial [Lotus japonicus]|uniref:putative pentatricopeptide repeat-containing protein At1g12700, mitochondrial n=1 Tax=Lotus japonicus TaxID=34305 RepID=UPI00259000D6|nr:putative pentatricopeptide repeat-containing protein At1g12700, mitochondrial [Lotus japonicus]XP_057444468.1 putative pentatricopeptide repeat-containing protein At1g12700, mitochondrial [Lotus japonicus]